MSDLREALGSGEFDGGHALIIKDDFWRERITGWKADSDRARDPITDEEVEVAKIALSAATSDWVRAGLEAFLKSRFGE